MEIRSNNVLIGGFALIVVLAAFLFSFWLARVQINQTFDYYEVVFGGSVSGLTDGGSVQYNGIRVGKVMDLRLDEKDPSRVIALIQTEATTPVKTDTKVSLQFTGLTGVALIQLEEGSRSAPRLEPKKGETYAKIIAEPSAFQEIFKSAPAVLTNVNELIEKLQTVVSQNQKNVTGIVKNIETLTGELAGSSVDIKETLRNVNGITRNVKNASDSLERLAETSETLLAGDVAGTVHEARLAVASYRVLGDQLGQIMEDNRASIDSFTRDGLGEIPLLMEDTRKLIDTLERIAKTAEDNPGQYLLGKDVVEYDVPR